MNQRNATYKAQYKGGKDNFSARYVAEYLAVPKICVNTHTHTHTHTHILTAYPSCVNLHIFRQTANTGKSFFGESVATTRTRIPNHLNPCGYGIQ